MSVNETLGFKGRSALVTGAGRGIGRAIAIGLAALGASVALLARSEDELDEVAEVIRNDGGRALVIPADMGDAEAVERAAQRVYAEFGAVDILVNNAAVVWPIAPTAAVGIDEWATALAINLTGAVQLSIACLPKMLDQRWGRIVNVSSGVVARPAVMLGANAYATSKAAIEAHTISLALELADTGVTVNVFRPGGVDTAMQAWIRNQSPEQIGEGLHDHFVATYEEGHLLTPEDSASLLLARIPSVATGEIWDVRDR